MSADMRRQVGGTILVDDRFELDIKKDRGKFGAVSYFCTKLRSVARFKYKMESVI